MLHIWKRQVTWCLKWWRVDEIWVRKSKDNTHMKWRGKYKFWCTMQALMVWMVVCIMHNLACLRPSYKMTFLEVELRSIPPSYQNFMKAKEFKIHPARCYIWVLHDHMLLKIECWSLSQTETTMSNAWSVEYKKNLLEEIVDKCHQQPITEGFYVVEFDDLWGPRGIM
jgi:hypothetical protein